VEDRPLQQELQALVNRFEDLELLDSVAVQYS
jgi:histidine ammonia-lyase